VNPVIKPLNDLIKESEAALVALDTAPEDLDKIAGYVDGLRDGVLIAEDLDERAAEVTMAPAETRYRLTEPLQVSDADRASSAKVTMIPAETWYRWYEYKDCGDGFRLIVPWSDPWQYEHPYDLVFNTERAAIDQKNADAPDETWVLCEVKMTPIRNG